MASGVAVRGDLRVSWGLTVPARAHGRLGDRGVRLGRLVPGVRDALGDLRSGPVQERPLPHRQHQVLLRGPADFLEHLQHWINRMVQPTPRQVATSRFESLAAFTHCVRARLLLPFLHAGNTH